VTVGLFGPLLVGWLTDVTGSYTTPFELCTLICLGEIGGFLSMCSAVAGRNSDYGRGQHFALDRLMLTDN